LHFIFRSIKPTENKDGLQGNITREELKSTVLTKGIKYILTLNKCGLLILIFALFSPGDNV